MIYNPNEYIGVPQIGMLKIGVPELPFLNVFGKVDKTYDVVEADDPYLLMEDGYPMLCEDNSKILLQQQTKKIWRQRARR